MIETLHFRPRRTAGSALTDGFDNVGIGTSLIPSLAEPSNLMKKRQWLAIPRVCPCQAGSLHFWWLVREEGPLLSLVPYVAAGFASICGCGLQVKGRPKGPNVHDPWVCFGNAVT